MRVKINNTIEVSDEQRAEIGELLGKKQATRDECRDFIWKHGADWELMLTRAPEFQEELIGDVDAELESLI